MRPLFGNISDSLESAILSAGHKRTFYEGESIFVEGESAHSLPIVISGSTRMMHILDGGREVLIGTFGPGEMFAVPPVFDNGVYPSTAIALEKTELLLLPSEDFRRLLAASSEFAFEVMSWMCRMLREKTATIEALATASPRLRIAKVLLHLLRGDGGQLPYRVNLRREDIARLCGLRTETTIRAIRKLADDGALRIERGKIFIDEPDELRRLADA